MTQLFYPPKFDSGLPGAKLTFTQTGTTNPQNTYTNEALTIAHANPVEADADGVFAPIYLDPKLPHYRVKYTTADDVLIYQVDNYPSNQNIQQSIRLQATNPFLFLYDTDGTSGSRKYLIRANGATFEIASVDETEAVVTPIIQFSGGVLYSNQTEVAVTSLGEFVGQLTGVDGTITGTVDYRVVNNLVTLYLSGDLTGVSNSTALTMTGLPVAIRPSIAKAVPTTELVDDDETLCSGRCVVSGGTIAFYIARTDLTTNLVRYSATGFTASGGKGLSTAWTITYPIN